MINVPDNYADDFLNIKINSLLVTCVIQKITKIPLLFIYLFDLRSHRMSTTILKVDGA